MWLSARVGLIQTSDYTTNRKQKYGNHRHNLFLMMGRDKSPLLYFIIRSPLDAWRLFFTLVFFYSFLRIYIYVHIYIFYARVFKIEDVISFTKISVYPLRNVKMVILFVFCSINLSSSFFLNVLEPIQEIVQHEKDIFRGNVLNGWDTSNLMNAKPQSQNKQQRISYFRVFTNDQTRQTK